MPDNKLVLVAEDHPGQRTLLVAMLEAADYSVVDVGAGAAAIAWLACARPDLVVTDLNMPDGNGILLARHVASMTNPPPVILCTSDDPGEDFAQAHLFADVLVKPYAIDELVMRINRLLAETA